MDIESDDNEISDEGMHMALTEWSQHHPPRPGDEGQWGGFMGADMTQPALKRRADDARGQWDLEEQAATQEWEEWQQSQLTNEDLLEAIRAWEEEGILPQQGTHKQEETNSMKTPDRLQLEIQVLQQQSPIVQEPEC